MSDTLEKLHENVIAGRLDSEDEGFDGTMEGQPGVMELIDLAIEEKIPAQNILGKALNPGMEEVGRMFESGEYLIPDMLAAAECVGEAMTKLEPLLADQKVAGKGKFVLATVEGDLHDIGKNIVATMLRGAGYEVLDLGTGVTADRIVASVKADQPKFLGLSALLTTTMGHMGEVIDQLQSEGLRNNIKVFIGGAPTSEEFARKIGADYYCEDAFSALGKLERAIS